MGNRKLLPGAHRRERGLLAWTARVRRSTGLLILTVVGLSLAIASAVCVATLGVTADLAWITPAWVALIGSAVCIATAVTIHALAWLHRRRGGQR